MVVLPSSAKETVDKDDEDCGADEDVELVSLAGEADDAEDDAEDGSGDEKEDSELDDAGGVEVGCAMKDFREAGDGRGAKVDVAGDGGGGVSQGEDAALRHGVHRVENQIGKRLANFTFNPGDQGRV